MLQPGAGELTHQRPAAAVTPAPLAALVEDGGLANAVRRGDFASARAIVAPLADRDDEIGVEARVLLGLYAQLCDEPVTARSLLLDSRGYAGHLSDLRLAALADSAQALELPTAAQAAWTRLLAEHPRSALRPRALVGAVEAAVERGDRLAALALIDGGRDEELDEADALRLATLGWEIGIALDNRAQQERAARRLLVEHPVAASNLKVIELFRPPDGDLDWLEILDSAQLAERAAKLVAAKLPENAVATLELTPAGDRDLEWQLLAAEALTRAHRGRDALALLAGVDSPDPDTAARLEWRRALAALDVSVARRDRQDLPTEERAAMAERALDHLARSASIAPNGNLALPALRLRFYELAEDEERFAEALETLARLRELDVEDETGLRTLWRQGWARYAERNFTGAIGYWSELLALYPESRTARAALYWSGRAHQRLGDSERGDRVLESVAAVQYEDFYRRHALRHLGRPVARAVAPASTAPWPRDPTLERVELLSDLGLDAAALLELEAMEEETDRAAHYALRAVILERLGERRKSIQAIGRAFPDLGGQGQGALPVRALRMYYPLDFDAMINRHAAAQDLPAPLVQAMIRQESAFDAGATSFAGARGLMQLMPATARELARRIGLRLGDGSLTEPGVSVQLGTAYYRQVRDMFGGDDELALAGYNGGPYRIKRLWRGAGSNDLDHFVEGLPLAETRSYVKRVLHFADSYERLYSSPS